MKASFFCDVIPGDRERREGDQLEISWSCERELIQSSRSRDESGLRHELGSYVEVCELEDLGESSEVGFGGLSVEVHLDEGSESDQGSALRVL